MNETEGNGNELNTQRAAGPFEGLLTQAGVLIRGHIVLDSKTHANGLLRRERLVTSHKIMETMATHTAYALGMPLQVDTFVGLVPIGAILAPFLAQAFGVLYSQQPQSAYCQRTKDGALDFPDNLKELIRGKRVVIVLDAFRNDGEIEYVASFLQGRGANVRGVIGLCALETVPKVRVNDQTVPVWSSASINLETFPVDPKTEFCTLCLQKVPMRTDVGEGADFCLLNQDYPAHTPP